MAKFSALPRPPVVQPLDPSYKIIALTKGQVALVDASDYKWLMQWSWHAWWNPSTESFYAARRESNILYMHREILQCGPKQVDHKNHNTLDNRAENLRPATPGQNIANRGKNCNNTSGFKGVSWHKGGRKWIANAGLNGKTVYLGLYSTPEEAHAAYSAFVTKQWGEFANVG